MTPANIVLYALLFSIGLIVLSLGARATLDDALFVVRRPILLIRSMAAIFIVMPAFALAVSSVFPLAPEIRFALVALSVSPIPPIAPIKQMKVGGSEAYTIGLLVAAAVVSLVATPVLVGVASRVLGVEAAISTVQVARTLLISIAAPLAAGIALRALAPRAADPVQRYASLIGTGLLLIGLLVILFNAWPMIAALVGNGAVLAIAAMVIFGLAIGHLLGPGAQGDRAALAIAAGTRHPGVAIAIATASFPDQHKNAAAAVLLFLLVNAVVTAPYVRWMKKRARASEAPDGPVHGRKASMS